MIFLRKEKTPSVVFLSNLKWQNPGRHSNILLGIKPWKISHSHNRETEIEVQKFCSVLSSLLISSDSVLAFQKYASHQWKKECGGWETWFDQGWRGFFWNLSYSKISFISHPERRQRRKGDVLTIPGVIPKSEVIFQIICAFTENNIWSTCCLWWNSTMFYKRGP